MSLKVSRCLSSAVLLPVFFAAQLSMKAQSIPCAAITRNPLVLEALLDSHSKDSGPDLQDDTINAAELEHLRFSAIVIQPGDALYMEYRGRDFTIEADFASGDRTAFDSSPKGGDEQWRKGVLPLDMFRTALQQRLVRLRATAKNPNQVLFRNIKIIRAGRPAFEFTKLASYGKPQIKTAVQRQLPCVGFDDAPANARAAGISYALTNPGPSPNFASGLRPMLPLFPMMMQSTTTSTDPNHYKFTGKELDDETGLYNYGARYYGPVLGRFMTPDWSARPAPIPYADLSNPQTFNLYTYSHNNPTSFGDVDGHCPDGICINIATLTPAQVDHKAQAAKDAAIGSLQALGSVAYHADMVPNKREPKMLQPKNGAQALGKAVTSGAIAVGSLVAGSPTSTGTAVESGSAIGLADNALVVRGGVPTAAQLTKGAESIAADGTLNGISVQSANGASVEQLSQGIPNNQIGVTTVGDVRAAGGDVVSTPSANNPCHCDMNGVTAEKGSTLFKTQPNPSKVKVPR